ncbi:MAG: GspE/PulE family protein [Thiobacillus sp.]
MALGGKFQLALLVKENYISREVAVDAYAKNPDDPIKYLIDQEVINHNILGQAIAENFKTKFFNLDESDYKSSGNQLLPESFVKANRLVALDSKSNTFATDQPDKITELSGILQKDYKIKSPQILYASTEDIDTLISNYKKPLSTRFSKIIESEKRVAPEIIDEIIDDALSFKASDVHFEPQDKVVVIRFRIDGVLHEAGRIDKQYYENILNRIKVMSQLRIDEHFAAQDGAIRIIKDDRSIDMRISIAPTLDGEKVTIRLLSEYVKDLNLSELGLSEGCEEVLVEAAKKPFGMILVCGPTGSGKSTTLYALIKHINSPSVNITTIEDPVEYKITGTNQIQVNEDKDITFAKGLRSIVRQDPDIILVGEVRDEETAEISVNAALTGHLLFTTFHANDAATAIPRLLDMSVEPFLLASTLEVIIAQRLVRRICSNCRASHSVSESEIDKNLPGWGKYFGKTTNLYSGKGCENCNGTGYKGRVAIFEFINVSKDLRNLILTNPSTDNIWKMAKKEGSYSMLEDGISKVKSGITTLEELARVVPVEQ